MAYYIGDLVPAVASLLGGRSDSNDKISQWIAAGYRDIGTSIPLETLEASASILCVPGTQSYGYPSDARGIKDLTIQIPSQTQTSPTTANSFRPLYKKNMSIVRRYATNTWGVPSIWAPFKNTIWLAPVPNQGYPLIVDYWQLVVLNSTDINNTQILVPDDWIEIIQYEAQMRGWIDLQEPDKAGAIRTLLNGNPKKPGMPGLIKQRLTQIQSESSNASYGVRPRLTRYGAGMK
jgi:hypothetical protein